MALGRRGRTTGSYQYREKATRAGYADSDWRTSGATAVTLTCAAPAQITAPASSTSGVYVVSWSVSATPGVTYVLEESRNSGAWTQIAATANTASGITGRTSGTYQYRVKATRAGYTDSGYRYSGVTTVP